MDCAETQQGILECLDDVPPATMHPELEAHVASCTHCSAFAARHKLIDVRLTMALRAPELAAGFRIELRNRVHEDRCRSSLDALPDLVHLVSCSAATFICAWLMPFDASTSLGAGAALTLLTYAFFSFVRDSFEDIEHSEA